MSATRQEVYAAIDGERAYQQQRWASDQTHPQQPAGWVAFIAAYTAKALAATASTEDPVPVMEVLRKIAALAVAAMEQHGAPTREGF